MLVIWRDQPHHQDQKHPVRTVTELDDLVDCIHAAADHDYPTAVQLYAGDHYPERGHWQAETWIADDPGDGPRPVLFFTAGAKETPLYWIEPDGTEYTSTGPSADDEPEFEYSYGGQESYAPAWSLIPADQAREAARQFLATGGQRPGNITWQPPAETASAHPVQEMARHADPVEEHLLRTPGLTAPERSALVAAWRALREMRDEDMLGQQLDMRRRA
jgi:hypothetical protein